MTPQPPPSPNPSPPHDPRLLSEAERMEALCAYLDGELAPADALRVAQWLDDSPELLRQVEHMRRTWDLLGTYADEPVDAAFAGRVLGQVAARTGLAPAPARATNLRLLPRLARSRPLLAAAALLLGVGTGLVLALKNPAAPTPGPAAATDVVALLDKVPADQLRILLEQADVLLTLDDAALEADYEGLEESVLGG